MALDTAVNAQITDAVAQQPKTEPSSDPLGLLALRDAMARATDSTAKDAGTVKARQEATRRAAAAKGLSLQYRRVTGNDGVVGMQIILSDLDEDGSAVPAALGKRGK